jgi:transketolase
MINPNYIRRIVVEMAARSREGHIASSFSIVEILLGIYKAMTSSASFDPRNIVLSKGHASYAYYAFLRSLELMSDAEIATVGQLGSKFYGHVPYLKGDIRFQYGSGSLGHGLPYAVGLQLARSLTGNQEPVHCIVGDGEANEGTFWESLLLIQKFRLRNLNIYIDSNGSSERAIPIKETLEGLASAFMAMELHICDGHNSDDICKIARLDDKSKLIICNTIKGYPIDFMMNNPIWHHKSPNQSEADEIGKLLG